MARPKIPLISKRNALSAALSIMDSEGLEALSIRRLADELGVNGASLYHHFTNKDEILVGAARLALEEVRTPEARDEDWRVWMARNATRLREALIAHPGLIPIVMTRGPLGVGTDRVESSAALLVKGGLPYGAVLPLLEALELFAISSAMQASRGDGMESIPELSHHEHPTLDRAATERDISSAEMFDAVVARIIEAVDKLAQRRASSLRKPKRAAPDPSPTRSIAPAKPKSASRAATSAAPATKRPSRRSA